MSTENDLQRLTTLAKRLVRAGRYKITRHSTDDHPEREITAADILECLKIGSAISLEPREVKGVQRYSGNDRYRWFGEDQRDRVLRLIIIVDDETIIISAAHATVAQAERYRSEDQAGLAREMDEEVPT